MYLHTNHCSNYVEAQQYLNFLVAKRYLLKGSQILVVGVLCSLWKVRQLPFHDLLRFLRFYLPVAKMLYH